ncbi:hypothetical protein JK361_26070 [Streptomyces sp. 5-8]|uniref:Major facilitator superfamily (MFS) profile domain-containing protein n=1 Tax=Streptomyces musisoli TaxID=2802280 RepID=A0ABS1P6U5_9ACTN|nr:hypothetical protein [Streptomyces musisoli]MBL1108013.1 hypothetical protein [Streptomyces musisoli]
MDGTQAAPQRQYVTNATLVTSMALGAGDFGFIAGLYGSFVGHQTLYAATVTGCSAAVGAFMVGMAIATFIRKGTTE